MGTAATAAGQGCASLDSVTVDDCPDPADGVKLPAKLQTAKDDCKDCALTAWADDGTCSAQCKMTETRSEASAAVGAGAACETDVSRTEKDCNTDACPACEAAQVKALTDGISGASK